MKRWLWIGSGVVVGLVILIVVILFFIYSSLNTLIKRAVERYGSEITQADVRLEEVDVSISTGRGAMRGLTVGNPKGFKTERAFRLGEIALTLDVGSLRAAPVIIKEIVISAPGITYELGPGGSNIDAIQRNVDAYMARWRRRGESGNDSGGKVVIELLRVENGDINVSATVLQGKSLSVPLPDLKLLDIGKEKDGASPGEVAEKIFRAINRNIGTAVMKLNLDGVVNALKEGVSGSESVIEKGVREATDALKNLPSN